MKTDFVFLCAVSPPSTSRNLIPMAGDQKKEFGPHLRLQLHTFSLSQTWVTQVSVGCWTAQCPVPGGGHGKGNDYTIVNQTHLSH